MHVLRGRADAFVPGNVSDTRQVRRHRCQLGQRTVPQVMQRQVPDFLFREASGIARRVPKRRAAIERAPNQAGAVTAPGQQSLRNFTQLDFVITACSRRTRSTSPGVDFLELQKTVCSYYERR
jgi:hypothetical protein